jgi:hypothetical protein
LSEADKVPLEKLAAEDQARWKRQVLEFKNNTAFT